MSFTVIIENIDPPPDRPLSSRGQFIEGCRIWAKANLDHLPHDAQHAGAVARIYESVMTLRETIERDPVPDLSLHDAVDQLVTRVQKGEWTAPYNVIDMAGDLRKILNKRGETA